MLFVVIVLGAVMWAQSVGAFPIAAPMAAPTTSTGTIAYQGRLADAGGAPLTITYTMIFRIYNAATGSVPLWTEQWTGSNSVQVSDGLFNVMLGSLTVIPPSVVTSNSNLWLGITVGSDDEMLPRVQLGSVPFSVWSMTVADNSITSAKIATGAITTTHLADGAVTQAKAPRFVYAPSENTKIAYGQATVQRSADLDFGGVNVSLTAYGFTQTPTVLCSTAGEFGFFWNCHVQFETKDLKPKTALRSGHNIRAILAGQLCQSAG